MTKHSASCLGYICTCDNCYRCEGIIKDLRSENARVWELHNDFLNNKMTSLQKETHVLRAENARYREALEFYASIENRKTPLGPDGYLRSKIDSDRGSIAREALKGE